MQASGTGSVAAAAAVSTYPAATAPKAPSLGPDPTPDASGPESRPHIFVPFPTPLDAGIALGSLAPDAEPHSGVIGKELTASDSTLAVRWTAEDSHLLQVSVISFLDQLSLVVQTMQRFGPPVSR